MWLKTDLLRPFSHKCLASRITAPVAIPLPIKIHDYRNQRIKDIPAFGKFTTIVIRKHRYVCPNCDKRFYEDITFLPRYHRMTNRLAAYVIDKLKSECSFTSVAKCVNLSVSSVIRIFDIVTFPKPHKLPRVFAIDEFKDNTGNIK